LQGAAQENDETVIASEGMIASMGAGARLLANTARLAMDHSSSCIDS
jgi:hypothetical protein